MNVLRAGAISFVLLLASRVVGVVREISVAWSFGATDMADVAVLMLALPDWITSVTIGGALAYVLLPIWAKQDPVAIKFTSRRLAYVLIFFGFVLALLLISTISPVVSLLLGGLHDETSKAEAQVGLVWSAVSLPLALLAALWAVRLQHERDFVGLYGANLVVNSALIVIITVAGSQAVTHRVVAWLGVGLLIAMVARLAWQVLRLRNLDSPIGTLSHAREECKSISLKLPRVWLWAILSTGFPLGLPFAARSIASREGEGGLAIFNYAWKLVELPLVLAIQLVATIALPAVAVAVAKGLELPEGRYHVRMAFALAWVLASAAVTVLMIGADTVANLMFGWGRMGAAGLEQIADWARIAAWGLLPQAIASVALAILASQQRMRSAAILYGLALLVLLLASVFLSPNGAETMRILNVLYAVIALLLVADLDSAGRDCLPWRFMAVTALILGGIYFLHGLYGSHANGTALVSLHAVVAVAAVFASGYAMRGSLKS